jgi:hypothetical protein
MWPSRQIPLLAFQEMSLTFSIPAIPGDPSRRRKNTHTHNKQNTTHGAAGFFPVNNLENVHVSTMAASPYYHKMKQIPFEN